MRYEYLIGLRYLRAKRKERFISLITLISMGGVMIGVLTLNVVLAVMSGFEEDLRDRILKFTAHIVVAHNHGNLKDFEAVTQAIRAVPGVEAVAPIAIGQAMLMAGQNVSGATVRGVGPEAGTVLDFEKSLREGSLDGLGRLYDVPLDDGKGPTVQLPGIILGKDIARELGVTAGDPVSVISPLGMPTAVGLVPRVKRFVVTGYFESGMAEYDAALVFMDMANAQKFFQLGAMASEIQVRTRDVDDARAVSQRVGTALGDGFSVRDWTDLNRSLFSALQLEKRVYFTVLLLIVVVAAFNIVATLVMVVMEKRKEIAILKAMGATRAAVARIFLFKGLLIGVVGTVIGSLGGYLMCWVLGRYGLPLPVGVFYVDKLPVTMHPESFAAVTGAALLVCFFFSVYPARQASRLLPVDVIRYD